MRFLLMFITVFLLCGCNDDNSQPKYGKEFGLPENCRAYVQAALDNYRIKTKDYKYDSIDTDYYCEPDNWFSDDCHQHLKDIKFIQDQKDEQVEILLNSIERNCGINGELWGK